MSQRRINTAATVVAVILALVGLLAVGSFIVMTLFMQALGSSK